jgi:hypothetical protein
MTQENMSFYSFLTENYELHFYLPNKLPQNDSLTLEEKEKLIELMDDKDFYEINSIIRQRYSQN